MSTLSPSRKPRSTRPRAGPLKDLPLDQFPPTDPNVNSASPFKSPHKRPLSPGVPSLYSPTKRRILNEEGIFSPDRMLKSPVSSSGLGRFATSHFDSLLAGPGSPAKKLDFGVPKNRDQHSLDSAFASSSISRLAPDEEKDTPATPSRDATTSTLAPSPEFTSKKPRSTSKSASQRPPPTQLDNSRATPPVSQPSSSYIPLMIPRELLPLPDRHSIHYPGFDIHTDTHIPLLRAGSSDLSSEGLSDSERDKESCKENLPPRRKSKKAVTAPATAEFSMTKAALLLSPGAKQRDAERLGKAKSTPTSPRKRIIEEKEGEMTPRQSRVGMAGIGYAYPPVPLFPGTPGRTPGGSVASRRERKRLLEMEVDEAEGDEEL
ncbi:hypothetical protein JAAARDRAFT_201682 [Jaapia argillacea MUCL 33604]|uniref:Uncharacterized protein n=1 Tax=Jaapia argillacea MUCL 33604 TaxID=933084 RepID=A0A067QB80_9AGAM|nr:hypothetical protein JAAARDRAFT_201682 [Jaapia argillacea MUCL 33604]